MLAMPDFWNGKCLTKVVCLEKLGYNQAISRSFLDCFCILHTGVTTDGHVSETAMDSQEFNKKMTDIEKKCM